MALPFQAPKWLVDSASDDSMPNAIPRSVDEHGRSPAKAATICLCMIVRNEAHIIRRAIASSKSIIDTWVICDTGSDDGTPGIALNSLSDLPGELFSKEWINFGHNRTEALRLSRQCADYTLIMDADMLANVNGPFKHKLIADAYNIRYTGVLDYCQPMLVSNRHEWEFIGVTHEHLSSPTAQNYQELPELTLTHLGDGGMRQDKFERDVRLLQEALKEDPENSRSRFYLAQSYAGLNRHEEASIWYQSRIDATNGWDEETWYAMFQLAATKSRLAHPWDEVLAAYLDAFKTRPHRLEPIYEIVRHYRESEEYHLGCPFRFDRCQ